MFEIRRWDAFADEWLPVPLARARFMAASRARTAAADYLEKHPTDFIALFFWKGALVNGQPDNVFLIGGPTVQ